MVVDDISDKKKKSKLTYKLENMKVVVFFTKSLGLYGSTPFRAIYKPKLS